MGGHRVSRGGHGARGPCGRFATGAGHSTNSIAQADDAGCTAGLDAATRNADGSYTVTLPASAAFPVGAVMRGTGQIRP